MREMTVAVPELHGRERPRKLAIRQDAPVRLTSISVENYSMHKSTSVDLEPVTVLIGRNGGGKSALLDALMTLGRTARGPFVKPSKRPALFPIARDSFTGPRMMRTCGFASGSIRETTRALSSTN